MESASKDADGPARPWEGPTMILECLGTCNNQKFDILEPVSYYVKNPRSKAPDKSHPDKSLPNKIVRASIRPTNMHNIMSNFKVY